MRVCVRSVRHRSYEAENARLRSEHEAENARLSSEHEAENARLCSELDMLRSAKEAEVSAKDDEVTALGSELSCAKARLSAFETAQHSARVQSAKRAAVWLLLLAVVCITAAWLVLNSTFVHSAIISLRSEPRPQSVMTEHCLC